MYQQDVKESVLQDAAKSVIEDCVCFTGVDVNVCLYITHSLTHSLTHLLACLDVPTAMCPWHRAQSSKGYRQVA